MASSRSGRASVARSQSTAGRPIRVSRTDPPTTYAAWPCAQRRSISAMTLGGGLISVRTASRYARSMADGLVVSRIALGAACVIVDAAGRVLLVHHTYGALNWEIPGGLVDAGESPDDAAIRELREETGMHVE